MYISKLPNIEVHIKTMLDYDQMVKTILRDQRIQNILQLI
jgi:hypothetical protein